MKKDKGIIGDSGIKSSANLFGQGVVVVCVLITIALIVLGILAVITYVR